MRVNVYAEEMTDRVELITKTTPEGTFTGVRLYLYMPVSMPISGKPVGRTTEARGPFLHREGDDDSSAITFWGRRELTAFLLKAASLLGLPTDLRQASTLGRLAPEPDVARFRRALEECAHLAKRAHDGCVAANGVLSRGLTQEETWRVADRVHVILDIVRKLGIEVQP